jgi:predicted amidophosphoribosyltransferase
MDLERWVCEFFNVKEPAAQIGIDVRHCPECQRVLSFRHDHYFCRQCHAQIKEAAQSYRPVYERQN